MESEDRGDGVDDQKAGGEEEEATQVVGADETLSDEEEADVTKEDGELDEEEKADEGTAEEKLEDDKVTDNGEAVEETEEEGVSDSKDELEDKGGGEEEGVGSMDEVEGQPNEDGEAEEEAMDDTEEMDQLDSTQAAGAEEEEGMEEGEEEEDEENGERPGAVEEEEEEEEENPDSEYVLKTAAAMMAAGGIQTRKRTLSHSSTEDGPKRKVGRSAAAGGGANAQSSDGQKHDKYCWVCHKEAVQVNCKLCPRSYHTKCMSMDYPNAKISTADSSCPCPECVVVMNAETLEFRSEAMKQLTLDQLMGLLKNICTRMRQTPGSEPFVQPVDPVDAEDYFDYIVYPMDIETLEKNIKKRLYGSTEGFLADAQWLVHNSIVFNSASSQYTLAAKRLLKVCKLELTEIETCPECYTNAHEKPDSWFVEACRKPHILVWAKLKGFPFWPAKAMKIKENDVDVRFFGQHDRAWVSKKDCFLYSEEMPAPPPKKNGPLLAAIEELTAHVEKLKEVHGPVVFAGVKTPIGPQLSVDQIRRMLPEYTPQEQGLGAVGAPAAKAAASTAAATTFATTTTTKTTNNNNNNNNNSVKVPPPTKKSPMTIRISSLKTNPTIVNISTDNPPPASDGRVVTRLTRKSSSAASAQQSNNPSGESDQDQSNDEGQDKQAVPRAPESNKGDDNEEAEEEEEEEEENVPEEKPEPQDETEEDTATAAAAPAATAAPSLPKGSEILASALGGGTGAAVRRSTRGMSRSGDGSESSSATPATTSATPQLEKRLTRGALKTTTPSEDGNNGGDSVSDEQPPEAVLEAMGLSKKTKDSPSGSHVQKTIKAIKEEPQEDVEMEDMEQAGGGGRGAKSTHNALMEQLTIPTSVKPGYRFNLSKDISISAVEGGGMGDQEEQVVTQRNVPQQRRLLPGGQQRSVPQGIPMNAVRPRLPVNTAVNGQHQQRMFTGQQLRQMVRNARPQHILNPRTGQTVRISGVGGGGGGNRPVSMLPVRGQQQQFHVQQQKSAKDNTVAVDTSSLVNPVQGPITLPGGTITVTPLTSLIAAGVPITAFDGVNGAQGGQTQQVAVALKAANASGSATNIGIINVQQQSGGGTTIVNSKGGKTGGGAASLASAQQRRNLMVSIPPSVNMHLQNLTKTMGDLVKSTVEQITLEIVEFCNNTQGKAENSRLQVEVEKLQKQLKQEVTDIKHNNDIAMRELRMTMENDKKRALQEVKRQMEMEKQKAIEETKKKQWCASCGREALFYCCWNTSYCGYPCQEEHWPTHMSSCSQSSNSGR